MPFVNLYTQVAMNTTLSAATGGITVFLLRYAIMKKYDVGGLCNGILAGLVSITAGCGNVECGSAFAIGLLGAFRVPGLVHALAEAEDSTTQWMPAQCTASVASGVRWQPDSLTGARALTTTMAGSGFGCKPVSDTDSSCMTGIGGTAIAAQLIMVLVIHSVGWSPVGFGILRPEDDRTPSHRRVHRRGRHGRQAALATESLRNWGSCCGKPSRE